MAAFVIDSPGLEEHDTPGRQIHFEAGGQNRDLLMAAGVSALGLQLHVARRGLEAFHELVDLKRVAVTGASGGAVLSAYMLLAEPTLAGGVMTSFVDVPRVLDGGGCYCDVLPGYEGPDPSVLAAISAPTLWISDIKRDKPAGLSKAAQFTVSLGPHSYTAEHRRLALKFLGDLFGERGYQSHQSLPYTPGERLRSVPLPDGISVKQLIKRLE